MVKDIWAARGQTQRHGMSMSMRVAPLSAGRGRSASVGSKSLATLLVSLVQAQKRGWHLSLPHGVHSWQSLAPLIITSHTHSHLSARIERHTQTNETLYLWQQRFDFERATVLIPSQMASYSLILTLTQGYSE